jgi:hypothetical protein
MPARRYVVRCTAEGCQEPAVYKLAAEWSDGTIGELKTYGLACPQHLDMLYRRSREKRSRCRLTEGETLSDPHIFRLEPERRDRDLLRMPELETP